VNFCIESTQAKKDHDFEYRMIAADGRSIWLRDIVGVVVEEGRPVKLHGVMVDVTERMKAEELLRESERRLAEAQRIAHVGYWDRDIDADRHTWSDETYRIFGLKPQERVLNLEQVTELIHPQDRRILTDALIEARDGGRRYDVEYRVIRPSGEVRFIHSQADVIWDDAGRPRRMFGTAQDVTQEKLAERALRDSHSLLSAVIEGTSDAVFVKDLAGRYLLINSAGADAFGRTVEQVMGKDDEEILGSELGREVMRRDRELMRDGAPQTAEETVVVAGESKTYLTTMGLYRDSQGKVIGVIGIARDVSKRRQAVDALRKTELQLRTLVESIPDFIARFDVQRRFVYVNPPVCRLFDRPLEYFVGKTVLELPANGPAGQNEIVDEGVRLAFEQQISSTVEVRQTSEAGDQIIEVRHIPEEDERGRVVSVLTLGRDVTERRLAEERLRASLREKEVLLKEVHHRVKNNLQLISSLLSLQAGQSKDGAVVEALVECQNRVRTMALVHENLYRSADLAYVRFAGHVERLCAHLFRSYNVNPERIALDLGVGDATLDLDRSVRCGLIINELVTNAIKHGFPDGRSGRIAVRLDAGADRWYTLIVSDDGVGPPPSFELGRLDSLGLQLVADLTEQLGGALSFHRNGGAAFVIRFQAAAHGERQP
jgi:PAS domain S-box-containing protein